MEAQLDAGTTLVAHVQKPSLTFTLQDVDKQDSNFDVQSYIETQVREKGADGM